MPSPMKTLHTRAELSATLDSYRAKGERIALVPTMGALHDGHLALVRLAKERAGRVVVSIFVNPTQFAPHEDFDRYPRTLESDAAMLEKEGVDLIYAPDIAEIYPDGVAQDMVPQGPPADGLESEARPHFFGGVATVVTKLFEHVRPDIAVFGEKDWQQLQVIKTFVAPRLGVEIVPGPTEREADGLALSSRNRYLSPDHRAAAPALHRALTAAAMKISAGNNISQAVSDARGEIEAAGFTVDYVEARHAETLRPVSAPNDPLRLLVAARIGGTRLIDNVPVPSS